MSEGTRTAVERTDSDHGSVLARFKAHMWQQEDLVVDQGRSGRRAGPNAFDRTRTWARARGGELSPPELHEQKRWTFGELAPDPRGLDEGLPEPIGRGAALHRP